MLSSVEVMMSALDAAVDRALRAAGCGAAQIEPLGVELPEPHAA